MKGPQIHEIFKVPIYSVKLSLDLTKFERFSHLQSLERFCTNYKDSNEGRIISNVGGYQSDDLQLDEPVLETLIDEIEKHANQFAKGFINTECCNNQIVDNIWFNINGHKDFNKSHNHPKTDIAGVCYITTPENCGNLVFEHPAINVLSYYDCDGKIEHYNDYNSSTWEIKPSINNLHLFPAWLNHYVSPNENETGPRISFSFNTTQQE